MSDDRSMVTIPHHAFAAMVDTVQRAVIDKGASKATRMAAFTAVLALVDAGLIRDTSTIAPVVGENGPAPAHLRTGLRAMG
jgi:hypothetical protein